MTIGFEQTFYNATEGTDASVEVCAIVIMGVLEKEAVVSFSTMDGSAVSVGQSAMHTCSTCPMMTFICNSCSPFT